MSVDTYNITEIQFLDHRDTRLFVDKPDYDRKCAELTDLRARCEKAEKDAERVGDMPREWKVGKMNSDDWGGRDES